ncbi:MAG TPA: TOBE domain-containing protein [Aquabacterium sp.]|nr:TOBE domain-containing protein [Aquabacterium sp.]
MIEVQGSVWLTVNGASLGGASRIALLAQIAECGSITQAAKAVGMSYKGAWDAIDAMNNLAGEPLVERLVGGKGGGGTRLTDRGMQLVHNFQVIEQEHQAFVQRLGQHAAQLTQDYSLIEQMAMKVSARNQFAGTVTAIKQGAVNDEIEIGLPSGQSIVAVLTSESTRNLGLQVGGPALAWVKSSSVVVMTGGGSVRLSARNQLTGAVVRLHAGAVHTEVVIDLGQGLSVAAVVTHESAMSMGLSEGVTATALFKASSVMVGVPA